VSLPIRRLDDLAESCVFVKQSLNAIYCGLTPPHCCNGLRHPFSRSYGANVPSSLERFLSRALVYSTHPPVSVYGTGDWGNNRGLFWAPRSRTRFARRLSSRFNRLIRFLDALSTALIPAGAGIFNLLCIHYALRPRVSSRLTLGGRTWPRKPWVYGDQDSYLVYRYSCLHSHWQALHFPFPFSFAALVTLSYRSPGTDPG
jgi:hypothetical protein